MKRIYEVKIGSDMESATQHFTVLKPNIFDAVKSAVRLYRKSGDKLYGHARVIEAKETGTVDS